MVQRLHLVFGGELVDPSKNVFKDVDDLHIGFDSDAGYVPVVEAVGFDIAAGETLALVGESGCGKSLVASSIMRLLPPFGRISAGTIELVRLSEAGTFQ